MSSTSLFRSADNVRSENSEGEVVKFNHPFFQVVFALFYHLFSFHELAMNAPHYMQDRQCNIHWTFQQVHIKHRRIWKHQSIKSKIRLHNPRPTSWCLVSASACWSTWSIGGPVSWTICGNEFIVSVFSMSCFCTPVFSMRWPGEKNSSKARHRKQ